MTNKSIVNGLEADYPTIQFMGFDMDDPTSKEKRDAFDLRRHGVYKLLQGGEQIAVWAGPIDSATLVEALTDAVSN